MFLKNNFLKKIFSFETSFCAKKKKRRCTKNHNNCNENNNNNKSNSNRGLFSFSGVYAKIQFSPCFRFLYFVAAKVYLFTTHRRQQQCSRYTHSRSLTLLTRAQCKPAALRGTFFAFAVPWHGHSNETRAKSALTASRRQVRFC